MKSFLMLLGGAAGVYAVVRVMEARSAAVPLDMAFKYPFTSMTELRKQILAAIPVTTA